MVNSPTSQVARRSKFDRETFILLSGFAALWLLAGGLAFSLYPYAQCVTEKFGDVKAACDNALRHPFVVGPLRVSALQAKLSKQVEDGEYADVLITSQDLLDAGDRSVRLYSNRAWANKELGKIEDAIENYRAALSIDPGNTETFGALMRLLVDGKQHDRARDEAVAFIERNPKSALGHEWLGWNAAKQGDQDTALQNYRDALTLAPEEAWLRNEMGSTFQNLGAFDEALSYYSKAIELDDYDADYRRNRARLFDRLQRHTEAQADYILLLNYERDQETILGLARSYIDDDKLNAAEPLIAEAINNDSKDEAALVMRVRLRYFRNDMNAMGAAIYALRAVNPKSIDAVYWSAAMLEKGGANSSALDAYKSVLNDWPNDSGLRVDIGHLLLDMDRGDESLAYFNVAVALDTKSYRAYSGRARANIRLKKYQAAIDDANVALSFNRKDVSTLGHRAFAAWKLGDIGAARRDYLAAQFLRPDIPWVRSEYIELLIEAKFYDDAAHEIEDAKADKVRGLSLWEFKRQLATALDSRP